MVPAGRRAAPRSRTREWLQQFASTPGGLGSLTVRPCGNKIKPVHLTGCYVTKPYSCHTLAARFAVRSTPELVVVRTAWTVALHLYSGAVFVSLLRDYLDNKAHFLLFKLTAGIPSFSIIYSTLSAHVFSDL